MSIEMREQLSEVEYIVYRLALLRSVNRLLLAEAPAALDPERARRALATTETRLGEVIALVKALPR